MLTAEMPADWILLSVATVSRWLTKRCVERTRNMIPLHCECGPNVPWPCFDAAVRSALQPSVVDDDGRYFARYNSVCTTLCPMERSRSMVSGEMPRSTRISSGSH